eukprot:gene2532-2571_t
MVCQFGKMRIAHFQSGDFFDLRGEFFMQFVGNMAHVVSPMLPNLSLGRWMSLRWIKPVFFGCKSKVIALPESCAFHFSVASVPL